MLPPSLRPRIRHTTSIFRSIFMTSAETNCECCKARFIKFKLNAELTRSTRRQTATVVDFWDGTDPTPVEGDFFVYNLEVGEDQYCFEAEADSCGYAILDNQNDSGDEDACYYRIITLCEVPCSIPQLKPCCTYRGIYLAKHSGSKHRVQVETCSGSVEVDADVLDDCEFPHQSSIVLHTGDCCDPWITPGCCCDPDYPPPPPPCEDNCDVCELCIELLDPACEQDCPSPVGSDYILADCVIPDSHDCIPMCRPIPNEPIEECCDGIDHLLTVSVTCDAETGIWSATASITCDSEPVSVLATGTNENIGLDLCDEPDCVEFEIVLVIDEDTPIGNPVEFQGGGTTCPIQVRVCGTPEHHQDCP